MERIEFKQLAYDLKELDESKGIVTAYANVYNVKDSDGDISAYGSFDKTVGENFKRIRVLKDHNPTMMVGVPLAIDTKDTYGLLTTTQFNMKTELGRDMFQNVKLMNDNGLNAVNLRIAEQYLTAFANLAKTNNTMILPSNLSDIAGVVATATSVFNETKDKKTK